MTIKKVSEEYSCDITFSKLPEKHTAKKKASSCCSFRKSNICSLTSTANKEKKVEKKSQGLCSRISSLVRSILNRLTCGLISTKSDKKVEKQSKGLFSRVTSFVRSVLNRLTCGLISKKSDATVSASKEKKHKKSKKKRKNSSSESARNSGSSGGNPGVDNRHLGGGGVDLLGDNQRLGNGHPGGGTLGGGVDLLGDNQGVGGNGPLSGKLNLPPPAPTFTELQQNVRQIQQLSLQLQQNGQSKQDSEELLNLIGAIRFTTARNRLSQASDADLTTVANHIGCASVIMKADFYNLTDEQYHFILNNLPEHIEDFITSKQTLANIKNSLVKDNELPTYVASFKAITLDNELIKGEAREIKNHILSTWIGQPVQA